MQYYNRKNTYVVREMRRRRAEAKRRVQERIINAVSSVALVAGFEAIMFALFLM